MHLSQQTYDDKITSYRQSWSGRAQACNYPSKLMKTNQRRSDGHGLVEYKHVTILASRLMKTKQRRSDGHGLVEYQHAIIPADL